MIFYLGLVFFYENSIETPVELNMKLQTTYTNPLPDPTRYYQVVGSLYVIITRAGTCFAVQNLSSLLLHLQYVGLLVCSSFSIYKELFPGVWHYLLAACLVLLLTLILIGLEKLIIDDRPLASVYFLESSIVSWKRKRQYVVSRSSAEAEYCAFTRSTAEIV